MPIRSATTAEANITADDGAMPAEPEREFIAENARGHREHGEQHADDNRASESKLSEFLSATKVQNATIQVLMP